MKIQEIVASVVFVSALAGFGGCTSSSEGEANGSTNDGGSNNLMSGMPTGTWLGKPLLDQITSVCAWAAACEVLSFGGTVATCTHSFVRELTHGEGLAFPWDELAACVNKRPSGCDAFRACLTEAGAVCGGGGVGIRGSDGKRSCDLVSVERCDASGVQCSADGANLVVCAKGFVRVNACRLVDGPGGSCERVGSEFFCRLTAPGRCSPTCAALGATCASDDGKCVFANDCSAEEFEATCAGATLTTCISGKIRSVDCGEFGGTCGAAGGAAGCLIAD